MIRLTRCYEFPAAHVLSSESLSDAENARIFGKCANPNGHGHNYGVEVTITGPVDGENGQIVPIDRLDAIFDEAVGQPFSHRMLNELPAFQGLVPTAEIIAVVVHDVLESVIAQKTSARLWGVRVTETPKNSFTYGEAG